LVAQFFSPLILSRGKKELFSQHIESKILRLTKEVKKDGTGRVRKRQSET
jgi:hypothetical protein